MTKTHLGTISLASAANGDITAWCLLAVVIAIAQAGSMLSAVYNILFSILYILFMFLAVRPFLRMIGHIYHNKEVIDKALVALMFLLLIVSSYFTEILGLHALFGAFIAGVVMPGNIKFRKIMTERWKTYHWRSSCRFFRFDRTAYGDRSAEHTGTLGHVWNLHRSGYYR